MLPGVRFQLLGPVRGWLGETELELGSPQQRGVLAMLLLARGRQVPMSLLIDGLWGQDVPGSAVGAVRTYVSRLRRCLDTSRAGRGSEPIESAGDGYALRRGPITDLELFEDRMRDARTARDRDETALAGRLFHDALALWQGAPLAGVPGPSAESRRIQLTELYVAAAEEALATDIAAGEHVAAIAELRTLLAEHPFREGLSELLMLALYKSGCQADALGVFDVVRRKLREELEIAPGPALQTIYQRILHADDRLMEVAGARASRRPGVRPVSLVAEPMVA